MMVVRNPFLEVEEAKRYDQYRPVYHHLPVKLLENFLPGRIPRTLDVACGTGHSTQALARISDSIVGCDISESMLNEAREKLKTDFLVARAEELPFKDSEFDYLNISMAFHWLDQPRFLREAKRVLRPKGYLGIDNYGFPGHCLENEKFRDAYKSFDLKFMKTPPRNKNFPQEDDLKHAGFKLAEEFNYQHEVKMDQHTFTNYLMTRSNFLELSTEARLATKNNLNDFYSEFFSGEILTLVFSGMLRLYQPVS